MGALIDIIGMIANIIIWIVIIQFVIGLLFAFNVVSPSNQFVMQVYQSLNALMDPVLRPIRRIMPNTGAIDFSPMVLIILLNIVMIVLGSMSTSL